MRILYVARHNNGGNQDENAISWALTHLGHKVVCMQEADFTGLANVKKDDADLMLFHKLDLYAMNPRPKMKRAFWFFDLVEWDSDPTLARRCANRKAWMERNVPLVDLGFCTDGDFAATSDKLIHLPQGFDTRQKDMHTDNQIYDLFFAGISKGGGVGREEFVKDVGSLGYKFLHVEKGVHGPQLAGLVSESRICLCPDSPVTDRYCSNRVYNMLGYGGFVLHPYTKSVAGQYRNGRHLQFYTNRAELHAKIAHWLPREQERRHIAEAGRQQTFISHSYLRRCEILLEHVESRLGVK